jgi:hypothetical protein
MARNSAIPQKLKLSTRILKLLDRIFIREKLQNWTGYFLIALVACSVGFVIAKQMVVGLGLVGLTVGLAIAMVCMVNTEAGVYITMIYSFFAFHLSRMLFDDQFPVGVISDGLIVATFFGFFLKRINWKRSLNEFYSSTVVIWTLVLLFYLTIELFNPFAHSFQGWFVTFRKMFGSVLLLFISFNIFKSWASIRRFLIVLFVICVVTGLYACYQQWFGLLDFERNWCMADETRFGLIFIGGDFRKFSTMSDPTSFGVVMAAASILYSVLAIEQKKARNRFILLTGVIIMLLAMAYSGTRTANAMFVGGLFMFVVLTINRKSTQVFAIVAGAALLTIIYVPYYDNATINRIRSTFTGTKDESYLVREVNRKFIQPYVWAHPIGGGLGTTGGAGQKNNPGHYLAGFPTDSGYLKKALETGWIGLAIICILYYVVLRHGINGYFESRHERTKVLCAASTACLFSFYVAEFPQEAIGQITDVVIYYPLIAVLLRLRELDETFA